MNGKSLHKLCAVVMACYIVIAVVFYGIAGEQLTARVNKTSMPSMKEGTGELISGGEVRQAFCLDGHELLGVSLVTATYGRENTSRLKLSVVDSSGIVAGECEILSSWLTNGVSEITFLQPVPIRPGKWYELMLTSPDGTEGNAISLMYGNTIALSRGEAPLVISDGERLKVNGQPVEGKLCVQFTVQKNLWFGRVYWYVVLAGGLLLAGYMVYTIQQESCGRSTQALRVLSAFLRYKFLIRQLVARDFKTKYKRSMLGILWSFLNPILTMAVQYVVFSTLFRSDIPNFALYLLTGIVCFNFFSEAVSMALTSIVGNAGLITKVYVPKYIYPLSRVLSSCVNLLLSLIPLFAVMLLTGAPVRPALLLLPFGLGCLFLFTLGIGLLLATAMVFFRDTQFLWGVVSMLWMYLTPIIYPENIIPQQFMTLYKCNPLYHIIRFIRIILMDGISPEPKAYGLCLIACIIPLIIGALVFKKEQDKFVVNL